VQQVAGSGFAIGSRYADDDKPAGWEAIPGCAKISQGLPAIGNDDDRYSILKLRQRSFRYDRNRAVVQGPGCKVVAIHGHATIGDEQTARPHLSRVGGEGLDVDVRVAARAGMGQGSDQVGQGKRHVGPN
jgi:hypothetical protein